MRIIGDIAIHEIQENKLTFNEENIELQEIKHILGYLRFPVR